MEDSHDISSADETSLMEESLTMSAAEHNVAAEKEQKNTSGEAAVRLSVLSRNLSLAISLSLSLSLSLSPPLSLFQFSFLSLLSCPFVRTCW
jgi:hypothetical protein